MPDKRSKLLIKEGDDTIRWIYGQILSEQDDLQIVASVATARAAIYHAMEWDIDLFLTNILTSDGDAFETVEEVVRLCPRAKVLYASGYAGPPFYARALTTMANGYLVKPFRPYTFLDAIRTVLSGRNYFSGSVRAWLDGGSSGFHIPDWW
jgi:DNA-binding NarL/FixJ family response regulator